MKNKAVLARIDYLKAKQAKFEKGVKIKYKTLELQDYLKPYSNLKLEDQHLIFSPRCEMNQIKKKLLV